MGAVDLGYVLFVPNIFLFFFSNYTLTYGQFDQHQTMMLILICRAVVKNFLSYICGEIFHYKFSVSSCIVHMCVTSSDPPVCIKSLVILSQKTCPADSQATSVFSDFFVCLMYFPFPFQFFFSCLTSAKAAYVSLKLAF